jgi:hypothetical protein
MTFTIKEISKLLGKLDIKYAEKSDKLIKSSWRTDKWEQMLINFVLSKNAKWLTVVGYPLDPKCGGEPLNLYKREGMTEEQRHKLHEKLLYESWLYNGVKYTIDDQKDIAIAIETADTDLNPEELKRYINQVLRAADEIMDWL